MTEVEAMGIFEKNSAIVKGYFVYASWKHGEVYVDKDIVLVDPQENAHLGYGLAEKLIKLDPDIIIGPEMGGALIAPWVAFYLSRAKQHRVLSIYAEKEGSGFKIRPRHIQLIQNKKIVIVDDILTTGGSVSKVVQAVNAAEEVPIAIAVLWNRGNVTLADIYNSSGMQLFSLVNKQFNAWPEEECPLCKEGVAVNTDLGHGEEFLEKNKDKFLVCPNCGGLAVYTDKSRGVYCCRQCGAVPAGLEFE